MKHKGLLLMICLSLGGFVGIVNAEQPVHGDATASESKSCPSILRHDVPRLRSDSVQNLCDYAGQVVLVVNTASRCGYTPQYKGLEALYQQYKDKGFTVLGFPSNDFRQELKSNDEIATFCQVNYGVSFPMFESSSVKGKRANVFYKGLTKAADQAPAWNFNKYLIDRNGAIITHFNSSVAPDSDRLVQQIEKLL